MGGDAQYTATKSYVHVELVYREEMDKLHGAVLRHILRSLFRHRRYSCAGGTS